MQLQSIALADAISDQQHHDMALFVLETPDNLLIVDFPRKRVPGGFHQLDVRNRLPLSKLFRDQRFQIQRCRTLRHQGARRHSFRGDGGRKNSQRCQYDLYARLDHDPIALLPQRRPGASTYSYSNSDANNSRPQSVGVAPRFQRLTFRALRASKRRSTAGLPRRNFLCPAKPCLSRFSPR